MRRNTQISQISELLTGGNTRSEAYAILRPMVENQMRPFVFSANVGHGRVPLPISEQLIRLRYAINRVAASLNVSGGNLNPEAIEEMAEIEELDEVQSDPAASEIIEVLPDEDEKALEIPRASGKTKIADAKRHFLAEVRRIREFCKAREAHRETLDEISVRPLKAGARLIDKGIPVPALLNAMTLHWAPEARQDARIEEFDFLALSREIMRNREITEIERPDGSVQTPHEMFGYVLTLMEARQPVMAIGPAGTGKSFLIRQVADFMGLKYSEAPMTPGAQRGDLLGRHTMQGFVPAEFVERYSAGGVFNFEEIDAADPGMLIVLNNAIESDTLYNPINGEQYVKHAETCLAATANTFALGANRQYTGREKLDAATIDRWRMGRVLMHVSPAIEESILGL
jgi:hypothetical protein